MFSRRSIYPHRSALALLLILSMLLGMAACGGVGSDRETGADTPIESTADTDADTTDESVAETAVDTAAETAPDTEGATPPDTAPESEVIDESETKDPASETVPESDTVEVPESETDPEVETVPHEALPEGMYWTNVAKGQPVSATDAYHESFFHEKYLTDGIWTTYPDGPTLGWNSSVYPKNLPVTCDITITVTLEDVAELRRVVLKPMQWNFGKTFPRDYTLEVSVDGQNWTTIVTETDMTAAVDEFLPDANTLVRPVTYKLDEPVEAKFFRIHITRHSATFDTGTGSYMSALGEIELLAWTTTGEEYIPEPEPEETEPETEEVIMNPAADMNLNVKLDDLDILMQPIFAGNECRNETVMFLDKGEVKGLLYPIDKIISVTSYDGRTVYEEGKDYVIEDGKIRITADSSIKVITSDKFYNNPGSLIYTNRDGKPVPLYWGEDRAMTRWQININYTHKTTWEGYEQTCRLDVYRDFVEKLQNGEDVTVFFCGDSITYGGNSSWIGNYAPKQYTYPLLFVTALADLFDYTVHFEQAGLPSTSPVPDDYVAGNRGTITYVNSAVGGWTSMDGVANRVAYIEELVKKYGCDLFVSGFGMNDGYANINVAPSITANNIKAMVESVRAHAPEASVLLVATMVPNPDGYMDANGQIPWYFNHSKQETALEALALSYRKQGVHCAVACMGSVSLSVLEHKAYHDYSGNNVNHPNDYCNRIYAQTLLQAVIGYGNMK